MPACERMFVEGVGLWKGDFYLRMACGASDNVCLSVLPKEQGNGVIQQGGGMAGWVRRILPYRCLVCVQLAAEGYVRPNLGGTE